MSYLQQVSDFRNIIQKFTRTESMGNNHELCFYIETDLRNHGYNESNVYNLDSLVSKYLSDNVEKYNKYSKALNIVAKYPQFDYPSPRNNINYIGITFFLEYDMVVEPKIAMELGNIIEIDTKNFHKNPLGISGGNLDQYLNNNLEKYRKLVINIEIMDKYHNNNKNKRLYGPNAPIIIQLYNFSDIQPYDAIKLVSMLYDEIRETNPNISDNELASIAKNILTGVGYSEWNACEIEIFNRYRDIAEKMRPPPCSGWVRY